MTTAHPTDVSAQLATPDMLPASRQVLTIAHLGWAAMFLAILIWNFGEAPTRTLGNTGNWYRIALVGIAAVVCLLPILNNAQRITQAFPMPLVLMLAYGIVALVSSQYIPEHSLYSMWKAAEVVIDVLLMVGILSSARTLQRVLAAYRVVVGLLLAILALWWIEALVVPSQAFVRPEGYLIPVQLQGVLPIANPDGVGYVSAIVAFTAIARMFRTRSIASRTWLMAVIGAALVSLILAQARTAVAGLAVATLVYLLIDRRFIVFGVIASALAVTLLFSGFGDVAERYIMRGQSSAMFASLSGRIYGWQAAWDMFLESPIVGHGFAAAARIEILGITGASTLHGSVFDVLVGVGALGFVPWAAAIVVTTVSLLRLGRLRIVSLADARTRSVRAEMTGMLALVLIGSITGSDLAMHTHTFMLFLAIVGYVAAMKRLAKTTRVAQPVEALPATDGIPTFTAR